MKLFEDEFNTNVNIYSVNEECTLTLALKENFSPEEIYYADRMKDVYLNELLSE